MGAPRWRSSWLANGDAGTLRALTTDDATDAEPALAPDGRTLAYTSDRSGSRQVWLIDVVSGPPRQLTQEPAGAFAPARQSSAHA